MKPDDDDEYVTSNLSLIIFICRLQVKYQNSFMYFMYRPFWTAIDKLNRFVFIPELLEFVFIH